ncbi:MAG: linear amide C-N hydrolase [Prevotella sp.]
MRIKSIIMLFAVICLTTTQRATACTGITLQTVHGQTIVARTIEWAGGDLESRYTVVPRGYRQKSIVPVEGEEGMEIVAHYGYLGLAVERAEFVVEGINEKGLSAGLFYFPGYGEYMTYDRNQKDKTISDLQVVSFVLGNCKSVEEAKNKLQDMRIISGDSRGSTVHWRIADTSGRQIVLEIIGQKMIFHENTLGVLTNSPSFDWHLTNLNNYINLSSGPIYSKKIGKLELTAFGGGSGLHGIPGDMTPPSRFIRAAIFQATAPQLNTPEETVEQAFHILNNFDIPTGIQFSADQNVPNIPSATQWTVVTNLKDKKIYYRTMYNSDIRCFDLNKIKFDKIKYTSHPLDKEKKQPVKEIAIK